MLEVNSLTGRRGGEVYEVQSSWENIRENVDSTPTMVFSVIGDSDSFVPKPWAKTVFQTALIEAAKSGGESWILYRGHSYGVSDIIREAYRNYGDMEFGTDSKNVILKDKRRHIKLISIAGKESPDGMQEMETEDKTPEYGINFDAGEDFLMEFEKYVSEQEVSFFSQKIDFKMPVPIAIIVCEGDIETVAHTAGALENKLPVIIMKGSGKAADLILDYLENNDLLRKKASLLFGIRFDSNNYEKLKDYLDTIKQKEDLIAVFDVNNDDPLMLSNIVGEAVVSCWAMEKILHEDHQSKTKTLLLIFNHINLRPKTAIPHSQKNGLAFTGSSLAWKLLRRNSVRPEENIMNQLLGDYKEESRVYVLNPKYTSPASLPLYFYFGFQLLQESGLLKQSGHILLFEALKANRCDYVRVLLDQGVKFKLNNLPELYEQTVSCKEDCEFKDEDCLHMEWILKQIQETHAKRLCNKHRSLLRKIKKAKDKHNDKDREKYEDQRDNLHDSVAEAAKGLCRKILRYKSKEEESWDQSGNGDLKDANISDILLWAIFANRRELAEICWLRSEDHLLTGLVCSAILQKLSVKAGNVKEQILSNDLAEHSKLFEQRCLAIMDRMYEENTKQAIELMDDEASIWGIHSSPLTFAYENFMYDVVAHTCSQKNMNKQWYNNLAPDLKPFLKSAFRRPRKFFTAPLTKYVYNYIMFFTMLVMYSAFVLTSISTKYYVQDRARVFEYYVYFWGAGDFIEELISCFGCLESRGRSHRGYYSRMKRYLYDFWNVVDLLSYALLITALFVRHFHPSETFTIARRMFSLSLLVMYLRFLEVFLIHRRMGPTLIMIKEMLKDLFSFLFLAMFVVFGVGIYYHANLWPDHQTIWDGDWTNWRIWTIIYYPYWQLYGESFSEFLQGEDLSDCTNITSVWEADPSIDRCPQEDWTVLAISAFYMLFSNLLLVNLVIAMFSYTFERVQNNAEKLWRFERYTVINDYDWRIPSPINLIFLPYRFCCCPGRQGCCLHRCRECCCEEEVKVEKNETEKSVKFRKNFQKITAFKIRNNM
ncbi:transient receptor potential cation channel subfamily M member 8-like [Saccostrea echinata]|uniref:transient receptor potential cation channel subfamily M member 8-like n=1 Tax=Saccostrea echinata TaxID=191078 RepID=UPI002A826FA2|nr:transient receptor potential cation channel subfamily M member 8-like [Saccostrea echinata]